MIRFKRGLAILLSTCMIGGMMPFPVRAEETVPENIVQTESTGENVKEEENTEDVSVSEISRTMTVTAFAALDTSVINQTLPVGASEADIKFPDTLTVTLQIQNESESADSVTVNDADTADTTEASTELFGITWKLDETESDGAAFDSSEAANGYCYVYTPLLPETDADGNSIQVADGVELPMIYVLIGEQQLMTLAAEANHYDENGFCKGYEIDPNGTGAWVKKSGDDACKDENCNGYQPMTTVTEDGTEWYEISNAGQLYWFADQADNGNLLDANVRLTADIADNEGVTFGWDENNDYAVVATKDGKSVDAKMLRMWNPIGTFKNWNDNHCFAGHFDGQGYVISGLYNNGSDYEVGIFSAVYGNKNKYAIVERVGLDNSYLYSNTDTGAIVGYAECATIRQCYNAANLVSGGYSVGGIVSDVVYGYINLFEVYNVGKLSKIGNKPKENIGQIVGVATSLDQVQFSSCYGCSDFDIHFVGNKSLAVESFLSKNSFYNGEVAYLLSQSSATWGQDLSSENSLPNPCASEKYKVYKACTGYTNNENEAHHNFKNGFCTNDGCDYYEEPHYNEADEVYEISNAGQLYAYADKAQTVYTKGARLMDDIVVNDKTLIGNNGTPVTETEDLRMWDGLFRTSGYPYYNEQKLVFDGNNHSISGLYAKGSGLQGFALHNYGTVKNLQIKNSVFISTDDKAGGIDAGYTEGPADYKVENCSFEGYVEGATYAGGIVGGNHNISNCYVDAYVKGNGSVNPITPNGLISNTAYNIDKYTAECTTRGVKGFTTDQFASGEVAYALNQGSSDATTDTWKQTLDGESKDSTPTLNTSGAKVYQYTRLRCDGQTKTTDIYGYTNDSSKSGTSIPDEHVYEVDSSDHTKHTCSVCGKTEVHTYTYNVVGDTTDTIKAVCDACGDSYTVKLTAPTGADGKLIYTGTGHAARTEITEGALVETLPEIEYATVTDGTVPAYSTEVPVNAGSYRARLTLGAGENTTSVTIEYSIEQATPVIVTVPTVAGREYNPALALTDSELIGGSVTGTDGKELSGTWKFTGNNIIPTVNNKGYQAVFTPTDTANYNTVTRTITVKVTKAALVIAENPTASALTYGQTLSDSTLTGGKAAYKTADGTEVAGTFAWKNGDVKPVVSDSGKTEYDVTFTPSDTDNYNAVDTKIILTVNKAAKAPDMPGITMAPAHSTVKVGDITLPNGWSWHEADKDTALEDGVAVTATAVYTGADKGNYETESVSITITRSECEHNYTSKVTKEPTTTDEGIMTYTCSRCGHSYTQPIEKIKADDNNKDNGNQNQNPKPDTDNGTGNRTDNNTGNGTDNSNDAANGNTDSGQNSSGTGSENETVQGITERKESEAEAKSDRKEADTEVKPYIKDDSGKEGWEVIRLQLEAAESGDTVTVAMNGTTVVPKKVFDSIKDKDVTLALDMGNDIVWKISGNDITEAAGDIDLGVTVGADAGKYIPVDVINNVTGDKYSMNMTLAYDGQFGFTATLAVNMESKNAGLYANLFYYNAQTGKPEFICAGQIDADGNVELTFTHASDYMIVVDKAVMDGSNDDSITSEETTESMENAESTENSENTGNTDDEKLPVANADAVKGSGALNPAIIIIIVICILLIALGAVICIRKKSSSGKK